MKIKVNSLTKVLITSLLIIGSTNTVYASQWNQNSTGWWYQCDNGSYYKNEWQWINGKCYYFDTKGYMLSDTITPDGYTVNKDGEWVINGVIQKQQANYDKWIGKYISEDDQSITVTGADSNGINLTYYGYSEDGWYTHEYTFSYVNEEKTKAVHKYDNGYHVFSTYYTLTDDGIKVEVSPAGGWEEGFYSRKKSL